jgi:uncharacterized protein YbjT (DUF2867 family)
MAKAVLITGATGKQGGSVIDALLSASADFTILALTRNTSSASAKALAEKSSSIKLVAGNLDDPSAIFTNAAKPIWGVFSVQQAMGGGASPESEERQGKALVDAAIQNGVKHFVYSSVDRHGAQSDSDPTYVPHFISKHRVEQYLLEKAEGTDMTWTILRPVAFMENFTPDFMGKVFATTWWAGMPEDTPLQLIATVDIGYFAAQALMKPEEYKGRKLSLAGDELTYNQACQVFKSKVGTDMPSTFGIFGWLLLKLVKEMGLMFKWFGEVQYAADIKDLKSIHPNLMTFGDWLEKESGWAKK